jgi:RHS repeat-associated protein
VVTVSGTVATTDTYIYNPNGSPLELIRQQNGETFRYWYHTDKLGSVVALTDSSGNVVDRYNYDVWGAPTSTSEGVPQRLRYAGYWWDKELGWYWVSVRPYNPGLKRWLQPDPSQQDGMRTYVYVHDDPVDFTDPSGFSGRSGTCSVVFLHCYATSKGNVRDIPSSLWTMPSLVYNTVAASLPTGGSYPYESPNRKTGKPVKLKNGQGYLDRSGDRWQWDHNKQEWDVQHPDDSHTNVDSNGERTHAKDNMRRQPRNSASISNAAKATGWAVVGTTLVWVGTRAAPTVAGWVWDGSVWLIGAGASASSGA